MTDWIEEVPVNVMLDSIFPYLLSYHLVSKGSTPNDVTNEHLAALGSRWKIAPPAVKNKSMATSLSDNMDLNYLQALYAHTEVLDSRRAGRRVGGGNSNMLTAEKVHTLQQDSYDSFIPTTKSLHKFKELERNYFGLPPYALNRTAEGIVYQARKPYEGVTSRTDNGPREEEDEEEEEKSLEEKVEVKSTNQK